MKRTFIRIASGTMLLGIMAATWVGCQKETDTLSQATVPGLEPKLCPQQTVHYTALAIIAAPPTPATGQLNTVYHQCFGVPVCGSFINPTNNVYLTTNQITSITTIANYPNVSYSEQVAIINYFRNIAIANAPICSGTKKKVITDINFYRDPFVPNAVAAWANYACCGPYPD